MTFKTKPAFLILSETILPAKVRKGPAIAVYSGKDLSWDTQDIFVLHFEVLLFALIFFNRGSELDTAVVRSLES